MLGLGILTWIKIGIAIAILGALAWAVDDYAYQRRIAAERLATIAQLEQLSREKDAAHAMELRAERAKLIFTERAAQRRASEAADLTADLAAIREVPDDPTCPVAAPISRALDLLREP